MELAAPQQLVLNVITPVPKAQSLSNMAAQRPSEGEGAKSQKRAHGTGFSNATRQYSLLHNIWLEHASHSNQIIDLDEGPVKAQESLEGSHVLYIYIPASIQLVNIDR